MNTVKEKEQLHLARSADGRFEAHIMRSISRVSLTMNDEPMLRRGEGVCAPPGEGGYSIVHRSLGLFVCILDLDGQTGRLRLG